MKLITIIIKKVAFIIILIERAILIIIKEKHNQHQPK